MYTLFNMCTYVCVHTYTHTNMNLNRYIHTCMQIQTSPYISYYYSRYPYALLSLILEMCTLHLKFPWLVSCRERRIWLIKEGSQETSCCKVWHGIVACYILIIFFFIQLCFLWIGCIKIFGSILKYSCTNRNFVPEK